MQEGIRAEGPIRRWPKATSLPQELENYARAKFLVYVISFNLNLLKFCKLLAINSF